MCVGFFMFVGFGRCFSGFGSGFFDELGFELHGADAGDFAVDVVISIDESDVFDFGSAFDDEG